MAKRTYRTQKVDVRWHAHAILKVRAQSPREAVRIVERRVEMGGVPWDHAEEADDRDGFEINVEPEIDL